MRRLTHVRLLPWMLLLAAASSSAAILEFDASSISPTDPTLLRFTYVVNNLTFFRYQELDILFPADLYSLLFNGIAGQDFDVMLFQPGSPPGAPGHYTALALVDNPRLSTFSVDVRFLGAGTPPQLPFVINQFDETGNFAGIAASGTIDNRAGTQITPEPGTFAPAILALAAAVIRRVLRSPQRINA